MTELSKIEQLKSVVRDCNKELGSTGKVYFGSEHPVYDRIVTGNLALDYVTGGGIPRGALTQFTGAESAGKTLLALQCVAATQKIGGSSVWIAGEGFDKRWAPKLGVNLDELIIVTSGMGDTAMETAMSLLDSGLVDLLVIDSFQSLGTTREAENGIEQESFGGGGAAQMWGRVMRRSYAAMCREEDSAGHTAIVGISQVRANIGGYSPQGKPQPEGTGIHALKHWKSVDILCSKGEPLIEGKEEKRHIYAREFKLKCTKNKTSVPERVAFYNFFFEEHNGIPFGVDKADIVMRLAVAYELLEQKGAWITGHGLKAQGMEQALAQLREKPDLVEQLHKEVLEAAKA